MHDIIVDTNPIMFFSKFFNLFFVVDLFLFAYSALSPKTFSSSVTAEQEELVAKMLASGMDEATAYQYLQQLCGAGVAGKGSKPKLTLFIISFPPQSSKCYQLYPCFKQHTRPPITKAFLFTNTCQRKGDKPRPYICVLIHLLLLPASYFNSEQPF